MSSAPSPKTRKNLILAKGYRRPLGDIASFGDDTPVENRIGVPPGDHWSAVDRGPYLFPGIQAWVKKVSVMLWDADLADRFHAEGFRYMALRVARGLFRIWIIASIIWFVGWLWYLWAMCMTLSSRQPL